MRNEAKPEEPEVCEDVPADAPAALSASGSAEAGTLLTVTFQKNPRQKYKYLEAEPKILGVTEIALTGFFVLCRITLPFYIGPHEWIINGLMLASSCVVMRKSHDEPTSFTTMGIISGSVAIAAQKLHLPTLKACLGMQVVTCVAYTFCFLGTFVEPSSNMFGCWQHYNYSDIGQEHDICTQLEKGYHLLHSLDQLIEVVQIVLSITIAAYCCKVIPCCAPRSHVPAIVLAPPTDRQ